MDRILRLTLKRKWFDMIASGEKLEEYREVKDYWVRRLVFVREEMEWDAWQEFCGDLSNPTVRHNSTEELMDFFGAYFRTFDLVEFTNGYGNNRPRLTVKFNGIDVNIGEPKWGAPAIPVFIIKLGDIVSIKNLGNDICWQK